ncbi:MAG: hypothetical protein GY835_07915 [bacterium]|nr:hypothetical protein [bacterium]
MPDQKRIEDLEQRLLAAEEKLGRLEGKPRSRLDILQIFMPIITGIMLAFVGFLLTGSVNNAINRQKMQLSQVAEMRGLILDLGSATATRDTMRATALTLSAFGEHAVPPLLNMLQSGGDNSYLAAKVGLRAVGLTNRDAVCGHLRKVLENRTRLFTWETHRAAVELTGELGDRGSLRLLENYRRVVRNSLEQDDLMPYAGWLRARPAPDRAKVAMVESALTSAILLLHQQSDR